MTHELSEATLEDPHIADDEQRFIIKRLRHCFVMLNRFPYNGGHLLVIPYEHRSLLTDFPPEALHELMEVAALATALLTQELGAQGFNLGINVGGVAAGGSIPEHLHLHVLPRWAGDTGFLTTLADTKPISVDLPELYQRLTKAFLRSCSR